MVTLADPRAHPFVCDRQHLQFQIPTFRVCASRTSSKGSVRLNPLLFCRPHLWDARKIREPSHDLYTKVHSSVKTRLKHLAGYENAAKWDDNLTEFVDEWALHPDVQMSE